MARIRTVKPEFFRHHELYLAEIESKLPLRVAFSGLWTAADREGRFKWDPDSLKLDCLPYDKLDFSRVLDALTTRGFIEKYASEGKEYGWIPSFSRHQVINNRERSSELPNPTDSEISTRAPRDSDACPTPLNLDQGEGKGKERKGREQGMTRDASVCSLGRCNGNAEKCLEHFDLFWEAYPRHEPSKAEALKSFCKIRPDLETIEKMISWIEAAKKSEQWREPTLIPHATTWLNQLRWTGNPPPLPKEQPRIRYDIEG
jgi:hypothetical protein